ncbi:unnamed protein product, partial [Linum tenue]
PSLNSFLPTSSFLQVCRQWWLQVQCANAQYWRFFGFHGPMATPEDGSSVAPITGVQMHVIIFVGLIHHLKILLSALFLPCTRESERWRGGTIAAHLSEKSAKVFFLLWLELFWQRVGWIPCLETSN